MENGFIKYLPRVLANIVHLNVYIAIHKERFGAVVTDFAVHTRQAICGDHSYFNYYTLLDRRCICITSACRHARIRGDLPGFIRKLYTAALIPSGAEIFNGRFVTVPRKYF